MKIAALYLRVLVAWLIAMQPLTGAYAAAQAAGAPLAMELCRSVSATPSAPASDRPGTHECCPAACVFAAALPPAQTFSITAPAIIGSVRAPQRPEAISVAQAGLGPQSARAPPRSTLHA